MPIILNVAPIQFKDAEIEVDQFDYSDETFDTLHTQFRSTHLILRSGDLINLVGLKENLPDAGGKKQTLNLSENLSIVSSLARNALYRHLQHQKCWINSLKPLGYLVTRKNIIEDCLPQNVQLVKGLGVFSKWEIDFRVQHQGTANAVVGLSINVGTAPRISLNCAQLIAAGVPVVGYYVGKIFFSRNPELKPRFTAIGRVSKVHSDGTLNLDDVKKNEANKVLAKDVYLEPREDILTHCIRIFYKEAADQLLANLNSKTDKYHLGPNKLTRINSALKTFQGLNLELLPGMPFSIRDFMTSGSSGTTALKVTIAEKPMFVFAPGGQKVNYWNDFGLQKYGPYSRESFSPSKPRICIVCQAAKKGQTEQILHKFFDGMLPVQYATNKSYEFTGLKAKYHLLGCTLEFFTAVDDTFESYNKAISDALKIHGSENGKFDLALVQIDSTFRDRFDNENPYLLSKARFLGQQIPVQEFTLEALGLPNERVIWTLNNMGLATYAKLNGIPWLLKADRPIAHEVVFGIGSAMITDGRFGGKEKIIGITTVFTGDGNYFVSNISSAVPEEDYFATVLDSLRTTMKTVQRDLNWQPNDTVRLVFHAFKTLKNTEADAVVQVMKELGNYQVEYAFLHIAQQHPYHIFNTDQAGHGRSKKGALAPDRGLILSLTDRISLVALTGGNELKQATDGLPVPVQLILHKSSTFTDMNYLSKQVVNFAAHSWRSFQPAPMPVTIFYSQLVAQMLGQLSRASAWNPDAMLNRIGGTRWFL